MFPSPTGVNYYESQKITLYDILMMCGFPSPTGVNYYELFFSIALVGTAYGFPSPTGVNYYEYIENHSLESQERVSVPNRG